MFNSLLFLLPQNIHQEIHPGLGGLLEQRCPLAYMGCPFSITRMTPGQPDSTLHHSWLLESFGVKSNVHPLPVESNTSSSLAEQQTNQSLNIVDNCATVQADSSPSIFNLVAFDKDFEKSFEKSSHVERAHLKDEMENLNVSNNNDVSQGGMSDSSASPPGYKNSVDNECINVHPVVYTAQNWDSKVLFQYNVEEEEEMNLHTSLTTLPFEILQIIGMFIFNFNLSVDINVYSISF